MTYAPKGSIIYGPVKSRRLGRSLGINLLPAGHKVCAFNCVYCQYGWTQCFAVAEATNRLPTVPEVADAVTQALAELAQPPEWLTFSGNGEPTLHPDFPAMVELLLELRDRYVPEARTAILSCSSEAGRPLIRTALGRLDARIMKLDAGDSTTFRAFNRPAARVDYHQVLAGLAALPDLTLQSLIAAGPEGNDSPAHLERWLDRVSELQPAAVQVYTTARPTAAAGLQPADPTLLADLAAELASRGISTTVA